MARGGKSEGRRYGHLQERVPSWLGVLLFSTFLAAYMAATPVADPDRGGRYNTFMRLLDWIVSPAIEYIGREVSIGLVLALGVLGAYYLWLDD